VAAADCRYLQREGVDGLGEHDGLAAEPEEDLPHLRPGRGRVFPVISAYVRVSAQVLRYALFVRFTLIEKISLRAIECRFDGMG
jgi:hypothetical protein